MNAPTNRLEEYLGLVAAGSLIGQLARARDIDAETLFNGPARVRTELASDLADLGIDPNLLASQLLSALCALFMQETNAALVVEQYTGLLWNILGDPKRGGDTPPELYRRAGCALHLALLALLDPESTEHLPLT